MPTGTYTISYGAVAGYTTPRDDTKTLGAGGAIIFTATYTPPDTTPPVAGPVTSSPEFGTFVGSPFSLTTAFTDHESPVTGCEYTTDGATWVSATVSGSAPTFTCTQTGITGTDSQHPTLNMRATSAGGVGPGTPVTRTVDAKAPTTTDNAPKNWVNTDQTIILTATDGAGSGPAQTKYCTDTTNACSPSTIGTSVPVTCEAGQTCVQYVRYQSVDNVGKVEPIQGVAVWIDKEGPTPVTDLVASGRFSHLHNVDLGQPC